MPMGVENAAPVFAAMMLVLQREWDARTHSQQVQDCSSKVIIDDIMLHGLMIAMSLQYFCCVLEVL